MKRNNRLGKKKREALKEKLRSDTFFKKQLSETLEEKEFVTLPIPQSLDDIEDKASIYAFIVETTTPFVLLKFQKEFFANIAAFIGLVIVASRQVGKTMGLALFVYAFMILHPKCLVVIISTGEKHAIEILSRIKAVFEKSILTFKGKQGRYDVDSNQELKLGTGSRVISLPANPKTVAGYSPDLVIVDECAKIEHWEQMRAAIFPMIAASKGKIVISSSFLGKNHFYEMATDPGWHARIYPWWVNPSDVIEWFRSKLPPAQFTEEFECIPVDENYSLFPLELIAELTVKQCEEFFL